MVFRFNIICITNAKKINSQKVVLKSYAKIYVLVMQPHMLLKSVGMYHKIFKHKDCK